MIISGGLRRRGAARLLGLRRAVRRATIIAMLAASLPACGSSGSGASQPLFTSQFQRAMSGCLPAPHPAEGIDRWDSPVGVALDMYYNQSSLPLTIESVALLDPHNLVLHGGLVYEMAHSLHPLVTETGWDQEGQGVPAAAWAGRQRIPGAVIPPGHGLPPHLMFSDKFDMYEIAVDISDATPRGGWALGEVVTYRAGGHTYTVKDITGIAIGSVPSPDRDNCDAMINAIQAAFAHI
jgi:hypothetical protein